MTKVQPIGQRGPSGRGHLVLPLPPSAQYLVSIQLVDEHVCEQLAPSLSLSRLLYVKVERPGLETVTIRVTNPTTHQASGSSAVHMFYMLTCLLC